MKKIITILLCGVMLFSICGCTKNIEQKNVDESIKEDTNVIEEDKKEIKKLTQDDDLLSYLTTYNNYIYYRPRVTGTSNSNEKDASVESHLLYFEDGYVYDIIVSDDSDNAIFENVPETTKEMYKYEISEIKLQSNDEEIYLKATNVNNSNEEFQLFFKYYSNTINSLSIYIGNPNRYYVYDYYYDKDTALSVAKASTKTSQSKKTPTIGMSKSQVRATEWGYPDKINKDTYSWGTTEQWVYNDHGYVYFKNDVVTSVSER